MSGAHHPQTAVHVNELTLPVPVGREQGSTELSLIVACTDLPVVYILWPQLGLCVLSIRFEQAQ